MGRLKREDEDERPRFFSDRPRRTPQEEFIHELRQTFPPRALDFALGAPDVQHPTIVQLAAWSERSTQGVAILSGATGCGKTVAATWLALQQFRPQRAYHRPAFLRASEFARLSRYDDDERARWAGQGWLVLDDLGAEFMDAKGSLKADVDDLIDVFYSGKRTLVITTNCTSDEFRVRYGARVCDRLRECGTWITVACSSLRGQAGRP